jgi:hypothetical protein
MSDFLLLRPEEFCQMHTALEQRSACSRHEDFTASRFIEMFSSDHPRHGRVKSQCFGLVTATSHIGPDEGDNQLQILGQP